MREQEQRGALGAVMLTRVCNVAAGIVLAAASCLAVLAVGAWLISEGDLAPQRAGMIRILAAFVGCLGGGCFAALREGRQALLLSGAVSGGFLLVWLVLGGMLWGGIDPGRAAVLAVAAVLGAFLAGIAGAGRKVSRKDRKKTRNSLHYG